MVGEPQVHTLIGHSDAVYSVHFSPNGNRVVSGSIINEALDEFQGLMKIWDVATGALVRSFVELC